jgi:hypothetical protein
MTATSPPTRLLAVAGTAALGISIAACGATVTRRTTPVTARPITSTAPSPVPSVQVTKSTEGVICAGLNAMVVTGGSDPYGTVETANQASPAVMNQSIKDRCPSLDYLIP